MKKRIVLTLLSIVCFASHTFCIDAWIRINQLGYLPSAQKKAILISESQQNIRKFYIYDALTNKEVGAFNTVVSWGEFQSFKSVFILDFSAFNTQGAFYIKAGLIYSPTIYVNKNTYLGTADFLLNYLRQQRCIAKPGEHQFDAFESNAEEFKPIADTENLWIVPNQKLSTPKSQKKPSQFNLSEQAKLINVTGGWSDASEFVQYGSTSATAIFQLLFAYQFNPTSFTDKFDANGKKGANGIPDILDEAKWGLDWLIKMCPSKDILYHQVGDDRENNQFHTPSENNVDYGWGQGNGRSVYVATGKPQAVFKIKNHSNGLASIAGKYASAFALGSQLLATYYPFYADSLTKKAIELYQLGIKYPGICQAVPAKSLIYYSEDNWSDDMELAASELYHLTYDANYLKDAANFGRMEPVSPWLCSDTTGHYQWYPFVNLGHYMLSNLENPRYKNEFKENLLSGIQRMSLYAANNPFDVGVPLVMNSNNLVVALATQCRLYRSMTNDSSYIDMENGLLDWIFGRNPWGTSMIGGLPKIGIAASDPHASNWKKNHQPATGGMVNGPVLKSIYTKLAISGLSKDDKYERYQSDWAIFHDDYTDNISNEPSLDGTASLTYMLSSKQLEGNPEKTSDNNLYSNGAIVRTDPSKKQISIVFSGNDYADGYNIIRKTLKKLNIKASFFLTGDFYRNTKNKRIIKGLLQDKHYLGGNSDKNLLYCSLQKRDSLLINKAQFITDLRANYKTMEKFGIKKNQTPFFLPPHEMHNDSIGKWCKEVGIQLINFTPGTLSNTDISIPEMRENYYSSNEIYNRILQVESKQGLSGHILLFHLGSDAKRQDKFYPRLYSLLIELSKNGYDFVDLFKATDVFDSNEATIPLNKQKRKN